MDSKKVARAIKLKLIFISIIIFLNIVGIGYGVWKSEITMQTLIATGKIEPVFSSFKIVENVSGTGQCQETNTRISTKPRTQAEISEDKKNLSININGAYPGYSVGIKYTITNNGTIPVNCTVYQQQSNDLVGIDIIQPEKLILGYGDSKEGTVNLTFYNVQKKENTKLAVDLIFKQYNEIPGE